MFSVNPLQRQFFVKNTPQRQDMPNSPYLKPLDRDVVSISSKSQNQIKPLNQYTKNNTQMSDYLVPYRQFDLMTYKNFYSEDCLRFGWKLHIYANNEQDMLDLQNSVGQYLLDSGVSWKTTIDYPRLQDMDDGNQKGKAIVIYPRSAEEFKKIAQDVDYIIRNNNLQTQDSNIFGDRKLGDSGRIFYRYDFNTAKLKDKVLDFDKEPSECKRAYERNRGGDRYLASDMTEADDPFLNFNPSIVTINGREAKKLEACPIEGDKYKLIRNEIFPLKTNIITIFESADHRLDCKIDVSKDMKIRSMKNGDTLTIGRAENCDIVTRQDNTHISRCHAKIYKVNDRLYIEDTSMNGTRVDI